MHLAVDHDARHGMPSDLGEYVVHAAAGFDVDLAAHFANHNSEVVFT
ncbi:hypothetical protein [Streptomyces wedmorensis]